MLRFVIHSVIAPDYFASVNHCSLYTLHYGGCGGDPLILSSFHSFLWIPTLLQMFFKLVGINDSSLIRVSALYNL